jgi:RHS repeat-associated protein
VAWSVRANAAGQIVNEWNPEAAAHSDELPGEHAVPADIGYSYDPAGRLVRVEERATTDGADVCTVRTYAFDKRGNRTAQTSASGAAASPGCPSTPSTTITRAYDAADRPTTGGNGSGSYVYDQLGRQLMVPSVDAPNPGGGNVALAYFHDDSAKSITQGNTVLSYALDISGRRATQTTTVSGSVTSTVVNHYTDDSDSPGWVTNAQGGSTATTVYADLVAEDLSLSLINDNSGNRGELALTTPRGDVAATITLATPSATAAGLDSWTRYTEYGAPVTAQPVGQVGAAGNGYGWLGGKQRTTTATIGLLLMGARLYNPVTGLFTSLDPVYGGNDTAYGYPNDPVNKQDTTGKAWWSTALLVASFVPGPVGLAASVVSAGVALARRDYSGAALSLLGPAGRFAKYAWRAGKAAKSAYRAVSGNRMRRAGSATRAFGRSIRATIVNGNNTLRVGRVNGNMRVSIGASRKHWGRMGTVRRQFYRASAHLERRRGFGNWHTRARTYNRRFY